MQSMIDWFAYRPNDMIQPAESQLGLFNTQNHQSPLILSVMQKSNRHPGGRSAGSIPRRPCRPWRLRWQRSIQDLSRAPAALSAPGHQIVGADVDRDECLAFNQNF